ncbi:MAG: YifB family Mg chelatase-like AAA ATPase [Alphaproteobacteria bacterium]|nr:YifB family Mg chelatase-like AAA ATPase [Alphaproteobacteria bacterium]
MVSKVSTVAFHGIETLSVTVEVQMSSGLPAFYVVGLGDKAVAESRERVRASFHHLGLSLPSKRITVNLAPADMQKEGSHYDLPIALGLMVFMNILDPLDVARFSAVGELGLDGTLAQVVGILPAAINASANNRGLICPQSGGREAAWAGDLPILAAPSLLSIINHFKGIQVLSPPEHSPFPSFNKTGMDMKDVKGQDIPKRALEIAASGGHNLLMIGPPGSGKSMLARRLPGILPPFEPMEALETTMIHSLAGLLPEEGLITERPFRDPHHSSSLVALVGGGARTKPGEISLAHNGVLFLDEFPEFARATLESLRQPLETGQIVVARANNHVTYPARIQLIAAMNPCRCGYFGDADRQCHKVPRCAGDYQGKISGPLMDRFDLVVSVQEVKATQLLEESDGESSHDVALRVAHARDLQKKRSTHPKGLTILNAVIDGEQLEDVVVLESDGRQLLSTAIDKMRLSARGYHRILRVSRTIADLDDSPSVCRHHIAEALRYRQSLSL